VKDKGRTIAEDYSTDTNEVTAKGGAAQDVMAAYEFLLEDLLKKERLPDGWVIQ
jgi:hypothetical protein